MLITKQLQQRPRGGRELLSSLNHDLLKEIYRDSFVLLELPLKKKHKLSILNAFKGYIDGVNQESISEALRLIDRHKITKIFVDGSNLGELTRQLKVSAPSTKTVTFFHNVETRFFFGALRQFRTLRALAILITNYLAERKAAQYSDGIICLSERDSQLLLRLYGRSATHISPISVQEMTSNDLIPNAPDTPEKFALFVGGAFYANTAGIAWFAKHVAPHIKTKVFIVGRGFENLRKSLELSGGVKVVGSVDDLTPWYREAHFVIAPIFDGSGMKTKVAEALMYGKRIIGTAEAFSGYEDISTQAGWRCETAKEFILAIGEAEKLPLIPFDPKLRVIYEQKYSYSAQRERLRNIMNSLADDIF